MGNRSWQRRKRRSVAKTGGKGERFWLCRCGSPEHRGCWEVKTFPQCQQPTNWAYNGTVFEFKKKIPDDAIKRYTIETDPATADFDKRLIYAVEYNHNGKRYLAQVGQVEERTSELIHAILGCGPDLVLICTTNRGAMKGYPIFVGKDEIAAVTEFAA